MLKEAEDRKMMEAMLAAAVASSSDDDAGDDDDDEGQASMLHVTASASSKKKKKKKKPKKKNAQQSAPSPSVASSSSVENVLVRSEEQTIQKEVKTASAPPPASSKKKKNKSKNKSKKTPEKSGKQMRDENFDNLLREFGGSDTAEAPVVAKATSVKRDSKASSGVLAIDVAKLDYRVDLKNLFGSAVAKSLTKQKRGAGSRTLIARGEADWPTPRATVEFRVLGQQADDGATVYGIEWSTQYAAAEAEV